ncbi:MAG: helix-turn-helix transcriptional regulator [Actinobacteria bacterium]|nr:helix-turn-helix transcriptional regulator [Actinomycetota bacterium]
MSEYRIGEAAELLGVSVDTVRRWADAGRLPTERSVGGHRVVKGKDLARYLAETSTLREPETIGAQSARNRLAGIVTHVVKDKVMAQVEMRSGGHRIVSLMSREAADELGLEPGVFAVAAIKATNVVVEIPAGRAREG